jgi:hypothetical protein
MFASMGLGNNRMEMQDQILLSKLGSIADGWSTARSSSAVKADTDISCTNNAVSIS